MEIKYKRSAMTVKHDVLATIIATITLAVVVVLVIYGLPFVIEHISELPKPSAAP